MISAARVVLGLVQSPACGMHARRRGEVRFGHTSWSLQEAQSELGADAKPRLVLLGSSRDPRALATGSVQPLVTTVSIACRRYTPAFCKIMCRNRFLVPVRRWAGIP